MCIYAESHVNLGHRCSQHCSRCTRATTLAKWVLSMTTVYLNKTTGRDQVLTRDSLPIGDRKCAVDWMHQNPMVHGYLIWDFILTYGHKWAWTREIIDGSIAKEESLPQNEAHIPSVGSCKGLHIFSLANPPCYITVGMFTQCGLGSV